MEPIRTAVIGCGKVGHFHARAFQQCPESELVACLGRDPEKTAAFARQYGIRPYTDPEAMVRETGVQAVSICTPHPAHAAIAVECCRLGLHIAVEKPLAATLEDCNVILKAAGENRVTGTTICQRRFYPPARRVKRAVEDGRLGRPILGTVDLLGWRDMAYYRSDPWRGTWRGEGGGVLINQAMHSLDLWQWICGMPVRLRAFCGLGRWHDIEVEDDVTAYVEYANGATGLFMACTGEAPGTNRFELSMDGGQLLLEDGRLTIRRTEMPVSRFIREYPGGYGKPEITREDITPDADYPMHAGVTRAFARHILYGEPMIADGREGLNALMLSNAMLLSSAEERTLELPFDAAADARYEALLSARAANSREKTAKDVQMDLGKSY